MKQKYTKEINKCLQQSKEAGSDVRDDVILN